MKTRTGALLATLVLLTGTACRASRSDWREGDVLYQTNHSRQTLAIQKATRSRYSHVGVLLHRAGKLEVFEAVGPVKFTPIEQWTARGQNRHVVVQRLRDASALTPGVLMKMRAWAETMNGRPYDIYFGWSDDELYCSELVWKIFQAGAGIELTSKRVLRSFDLTHPVVKGLMRERYGERIPWDEPVVSPVDLLKSKLLKTVDSR